MTLGTEDHIVSVDGGCGWRVPHLCRAKKLGGTDLNSKPNPKKL